MAEHNNQAFDLNQLTEAQDETTNRSQTSNPAFQLLSAQQSRRGSSTSKNSYLSVASKTTQRTEKPTRESIFTTSKPEGAFRDEIVVELQTLDDQTFRGSITLREARKKIFQEILGFKQEELAGLILGYSGCPIVTFKLFSPFNIDLLENFQFFELKRKITVRNEEKTSILKCKIRGIRTERRVDGKNYEDTGIRWVKVEGCEYRLEKEQIIEWLSNFGEVRSDLTEDTHEESDDSADDLPRVGNGIYSVKMKLSKDMPQFMPMYGKRIRLYYRGITKRCTNCFQPHQRKHCKNEKVTWFEYVKGFAEIFPEIPRSMYGKWASMTEKLAMMVNPNKKMDEIPETEKTNTESENQSSEIQTSQTGTQSERERGGKDLKKRGVVVVDEEDEDWDEDRKTDEEELGQLFKKMLASGISAKSIKNKMEKGSKEEKAKLKALDLGKGRGRGGGRGKTK